MRSAKRPGPVGVEVLAQSGATKFYCLYKLSPQQGAGMSAGEESLYFQGAPEAVMGRRGARHVGETTATRTITGGCGSLGQCSYRRSRPGFSLRGPQHRSILPRIRRAAGDRPFFRTRGWCRAFLGERDDRRRSGKNRQLNGNAVTQQKLRGWVFPTKQNRDEVERPLRQG